MGEAASEAGEERASGVGSVELTASERERVRHDWDVGADRGAMRGSEASARDSATVGDERANRASAIDTQGETISGFLVESPLCFD